ncbi:unnamed protein product, partial [Closterium sp. Naga37s-1]
LLGIAGQLQVGRGIESVHVCSALHGPCRRQPRRLPALSLDQRRVEPLCTLPHLPHHPKDRCQNRVALFAHILPYGPTTRPRASGPRHHMP